jgi:hypothetical protein
VYRTDLFFFLSVYNIDLLSTDIRNRRMNMTLQVEHCVRELRLIVDVKITDPNNRLRINSSNMVNVFVFLSQKVIPKLISYTKTRCIQCRSIAYI